MVCAQVDVASAPAVAAIRPTARDELLASKAHDSMPTIAGFHIDAGLVDEGPRWTRHGSSLSAAYRGCTWVRLSLYSTHGLELHLRRRAGVYVGRGIVGKTRIACAAIGIRWCRVCARGGDNARIGVEKSRC